MQFNDSITQLKGIGPKKAELLEKLNIRTIGDLIGFYPRTYQDRRTVTPIADAAKTNGEASLVRGFVTSIVKSGYRPSGKRPLTVVIDDGTARLEVVFFNGKFLENAFKRDEEYYFYGKATKDYGKIKMLHPEFSLASKGGFHGIVPIYSLTAGLAQNDIRKWQREAYVLMDGAEEYLPADIIERNKLCSYSYALRNIHFPDDVQQLKEARYRLVFEEMLLLQTGLFAVRDRKAGIDMGIAFDKTVDAYEFVKSLPYDLTNAQKKVTAEILSDMESSNVMSRLVQGDVGSGKTAIAEIAMFKAAKCGFQAVLMAPTEILAKQHFEGIKADFEPFGINVGFLSSSVARAERRELLEQLADGRISVLIGTHAVIQSDVEFKNLGLVITDEQHRFGVKQRNLLSSKGQNPDMLVMTATPIPRTLAVILYGDLDISIIDELPPGRQEIKTIVSDQKGRKAVYASVRKQLAEGRQAYVVAPLIEDSDSEAVAGLRSAESLYEELTKIFPEYKVALLHGEMKQKEKDEIMEAFSKNEIQVLVSTVVIEVGINVPNATVMVIENAERFGLAQMHQLRGRVGRGKHQSYCVLITDAKSQVAKERANIMASTSSGFVIAEKDLELRGPGEFFGTRQHGLPDMRLANLVTHIDLLEIVKEEAKLILDDDPKLTKPENTVLRKRIEAMFDGEIALKM